MSLRTQELTPCGSAEAELRCISATSTPPNMCHVPSTMDGLAGSGSLHCMDGGSTMPLRS
eukprot:CAMPEP_0203987072 /NCGR_PEP_ID=MMETSP0360-20130528/6496_1 /ASSEMBLY_ACC=CAM_ASM_000342 /TAXON_ID=268821 /ORGANISM="Scrippsiella Hangoei, Strain SHTV-5" /LENGTH=59 /DNA_ID=CAMNT_0050926635 /DNA_START=45 /DNA_END=222 /DNA_ORIENTATION=-